VRHSALLAVHLDLAGKFRPLGGRLRRSRGEHEPEGDTAATQSRKEPRGSGIIAQEPGRRFPTQISAQLAAEEDWAWEFEPPSQFAFPPQYPREGTSAAEDMMELGLTRAPLRRGSDAEPNGGFSPFWDGRSGFAQWDTREGGGADGRIWVAQDDGRPPGAGSWRPSPSFANKTPSGGV
jgi:hypothetical protein